MTRQPKHEPAPGVRRGHTTDQFYFILTWFGHLDGPTDAVVNLFPIGQPEVCEARSVVEFQALVVRLRSVERYRVFLGVANFDSVLRIPTALHLSPPMCVRSG